MSGPRLSSAAQLRYMMEWFEEWSELQRQDFLPVLAEKMTEKLHVETLANNLAAVNCHGKPKSLFQCRIKLFNEWYPTWGEDERSRLVHGINNIDPGFGSRLQEKIDSAEIPVNGISNGVHIDEEAVTEPPTGVSTNKSTVETDEKEEDICEEREENKEEKEMVQETVQNAIPIEIAATS